MSRARRRAGHRDSVSRGRIELHIDRLVLDGFSINAVDAARIHGAMERELGRLVATMPTHSWTASTAPVIRPAPITLAADAPAGVWGRQIARSVFATLSPEGAGSDRVAGRQSTAERGRSR
jgi:hypothetical protein